MLVHTSRPAGPLSSPMDAPYPEGTMSLSAAVVLVVEDNPLILMNALDVVRTAGFEGVGATDADEAIAILEARADIQLVFTDVEMPGAMDGVELAHYVRNRWPPIQLIIASSRAIQEKSQLPTGSRFFPKPYGDKIIVEEMIRMLAATDTSWSVNGT